MESEPPTPSRPSDVQENIKHCGGNSEKLPIALTLILHYLAAGHLHGGSLPLFFPFMQEIPTKTFPRGSSWAKCLLQLMATW